MTPEWWGAVDSNWADSTVAVQSAMDSAARGVLLMSSYQVSRVSLEGSGRLLVRTHYLTWVDIMRIRLRMHMDSLLTYVAYVLYRKGVAGASLP